DEKSRKYCSLVNWVQPKDVDTRERNTVALVSSEDLKTWTIERIILHHPDPHNHAFQYLDWQFEEDDIIAVSRTAYDDGLGGAANYHDANFMTFHRIKNFRVSFSKD
ncbi:MAG: exo-alpha-sialidase, partial [Bacteroidales bacterium]